MPAKEPEFTPDAPPAVDHLVLIEVLQHRTQIGSHIKAIGHKEELPLSKAKPLEELGHVRIIGIR